MYWDEFCGCGNAMKGNRGQLIDSHKPLEITLRSEFQIRKVSHQTLFLVLYEGKYANISALSMVLKNIGALKAVETVDYWRRDGIFERKKRGFITSQDPICLGLAPLNSLAVQFRAKNRSRCHGVKRGVTLEATCLQQLFSVLNSG